MGEAVQRRRAQWTGQGFIRRSIRPLLLAGALWLLAFAADIATDQQYSAVFGSLAIAGSILAVVPSVRRPAIALGAYGLCWVAFNLARAVADSSSLALASPEWIARLERGLAGGELPSTRFQELMGDGALAQAATWVGATVHLSFFLVPTIVALLLWRASPPEFTAYTWATAVGFAVSVVGFVLLPTAPPWLAEPGRVDRLISTILPGTAFGGGEEGGLAFEPNHLAAMPSVHVMAAVLVAFAATSRGGWIARFGMAYAVAMSVAVVILGEHYVLDVIAGWAVAVLAWRVARPLAASRSEAD